MAKKNDIVDVTLPIGNSSCARVTCFRGDQAAYIVMPKAVYGSSKDLRKLADTLIKAAQLLESNLPN